MVPTLPFEVTPNQLQDRTPQQPAAAVSLEASSRVQRKGDSRSTRNPTDPRMRGRNCTARTALRHFICIVWCPHGWTTASVDRKVVSETHRQAHCSNLSCHTLKQGCFSFCFKKLSVLEPVKEKNLNNCFRIKHQPHQETWFQLIHPGKGATTHTFTKTQATSFLEENPIKGMSTVTFGAHSCAKKKMGQTRVFSVSGVKHSEDKLHASPTKRATRRWNC